MMDGSNPMCLLLNAQKDYRKVIINLRNNRKMICNVVAFDKHFNCVLKDVLEIGKNKGIKKKEGYEYEKELGNIYLRGDNVISVTLID